MTLDTWLMFSLAAFITICSPGPAVLLAITNSVSSGMKSVIASSLGNITGLLILSSISILGLGVVIQTSAILFMTLKLMGAAYLIYLGVKKFRSNESFLVDYDIDHKPLLNVYRFLENVIYQEWQYFYQRLMVLFGVGNHFRLHHFHVE